jgi:hypothetical protein
MARTSRRRLHRRQAAAEPVPQHDTEDDILALGAKLDRLRRRVKRLGRKMHPGGDPILWSRWSRAVSECVELCEQIAKLPVKDLAGLALRYRALLWELIEDDLILDHAVRRRAIAFGRELERLAGGVAGVPRQPGSDSRRSRHSR